MKPNLPAIIKKEVDILDVAEQQLNLELKKQGKYYVALCPVHNEKTASFSIDTDRQTFHCFGCKESGDVIKLVQIVKNLHFFDACMFFTENCNIQLPDLTFKDENYLKKEELYLVNEAAKKFFQENLNDKCIAFLKAKCINEDSYQEFCLGYAPGGNGLLNSLRQLGHKEDVLFEAGLIGRNDQGNYYDFFRDRLMFPIHNKQGKVIGFGGRAFKEGTAKYLNTKDTLVYEKSKALFGIYEANNSYTKSQKDNVFIVEGYTDLIIAHQKGLKNSVALCGTALSDDQIQILAKSTKNITLLLDGDSSGERAMNSFIQPIFKAGCLANLVLLPNGKDPNDIVIDGESLVGFIEENKQDAIEATFKTALQKANSAGEKAKVIRACAELISLVDDELCRETYIDTLTKKNKLGKKILSKPVKEFLKNNTESTDEIKFDIKKHKHVKILDNYYAVIPKISSYNSKSVSAELVLRKASELKREYGEAYLSDIPRFDGIVSEPEHFNLKSNIEIFFEGHTYRKLNWYYALPKEPQAFTLPEISDNSIDFYVDQLPQIKNTLLFLKHIGGDFWIHVLDYLSILLCYPKRHLPALCLVSREKGTGKSTMIYLLRAMFGENAAKADAKRLASNFNKFMLGKLILAIEETHDEKGAVQETLKDYITGLEIQIEGKGQESISVPSYMKFIFCSNYPETFLKGGDDDRFFVLEVPKIPEGKKDNGLLKKMIEEIPHFLYFLKERKIQYPDKGRLWFERIPTPALERLKVASEPATIRNLKEFLHALFCNKLEKDEKLIKEIKLHSKAIAKYLNKFNSTKQYQPYKITTVLKRMGFIQSKNSTRFNYPHLDPSEIGDWTVEWQSVAGRYFTFNINDFLSPKDIREIFKEEGIKEMFTIEEIKELGLLPVQLDIES